MRCANTVRKLWLAHTPNTGSGSATPVQAWRSPIGLLLEIPPVVPLRSSAPPGPFAMTGADFEKQSSISGQEKFKSSIHALIQVRYERKSGKLGGN